MDWQKMQQCCTRPKPMVTKRGQGSARVKGIFLYLFSVRISDKLTS